MPDHDPERWLAEMRAGSDAMARRRQRWLEEQAAEAATLRGLLHDLAESEEVVAIETTGSGTHHGRLRGVGVDVAVLANPQGHGLVLLATDDIELVRTAKPHLASDRGPTFDVTLQELLIDQMAERAEVTVVTRSRGRHRGTLRSVGLDFVTVWRGANEPAVQIASSAIIAVLL
ncbi:MAG: hypothetical protein R2770_18685 [Acidimicrobiales bacterium]